ncbi:uncharacterized protein [Palaemon carinicauda]|uniref:uncharacterized protein isoform X1 n=1 Tax=Palaemon carinicauda TaxID=392227 RepID=UPI0035B5E4A5
MAEESRDHWEQAEREIGEVILINEKKIGELQKTNTILADDTRLKLDRIEMENHDIIQKLQGYNAEMKRVTNLVTEMLAVVSEARKRAKRSESFAEYGRNKDNVSHMLKHMQSSINKITADITNNRALHQKINEDTNIKLMKIQEILRLIPATDVMAGSLSTYRCITVNDLKRTRGEVYAVKIMNGRRRYSRIVKSDKDGRILHVHRLKDEPNISPNAQFIKYEEITELTHYSDRMTFMDFGSGGKSLVRIVIKYYNDVNFLNHVRNHILLCTGERGPSYVNSKVLEVRDKGRAGEFLILGDFERNDGTAGRAVVSSKEAGVWWKRGASVGMLSSYLCQHGSTEATASQFCILTQKYYGAKIFAYVKEGLSALSSVIRKCDNVREIEIIDCGRVVYC